MSLKSELSSAVLSEVELAEDVKGGLGHGGHGTGSSDGLGRPVTHGQHTHTQVNSIQTHLHTLEQ